MTKIKLNGTIVNDDVADLWGQSGFCWPAKFDRALKKAGGGPVELYINSDGGLVSAQWEIINMMREYQGEITAIIAGRAASSAANIYLYADKREYYDTSELLLHRSKTIMHGNALQFAEIADVLEKTDRATMGRIVELTGLTENEVKDKMEKDWIMIGDEIEIIGAKRTDAAPKKIKTKQYRIAIDESEKIKIAMAKGGEKMEQVLEPTQAEPTQAEPTQAEPEQTDIQKMREAETQRIGKIVEAAGGYTPAAKAAIASGMEAGEFALEQCGRYQLADTGGPTPCVQLQDNIATAEAAAKTDVDYKTEWAKARQSG